MKKKQVVIIGGGHNGLVCCAYLAKAGFNVTVVERRHIIGGAAVTEEFHPGFRNSVASYTVSLLHPKIINDLHLYEHGLEVLPRRINNFLPFSDGRSLLSYSELKKTCHELAQFSSADAENLVHYYQSLDEIVPVVKEIMLLTPPAIVDGGLSDLFKLFNLSQLFRKLDNTQKQFLLKLFTVSAGELLDDIFESDAIKVLLGFDAIVGHFASPYSPGSAYVLCIMYWVRLTEITRQGAKNVHLVDGSSIEADIIVANVNPKLLFQQLIEPDYLSDELLNHFKGYKCQSGTFRMNVALDSLPKFNANMPEFCLEAGIIMASSLDYMDQAYTDARRNGWSNKPIVEMLIPSTVDSSLAPDGQHVASLFCQQFNPDLGSNWDSHREKVADIIIDTVESYAPGFTKSVIARQIHSPWDLQQKFGLTGGDIFHGRLSLDQLFSARPMLGMAQYQTEISNLFLCGSGTHPGGGVSGIPGHNAAREIIRKY